MDGWAGGRGRWLGWGGVGLGLGWEIPPCKQQRRLSVRLGPQAIMVNPYPAGPRTQFPASLIENDGLFFFFFLVWVNKTRSHLWKKKHFVWFCSWSSCNLIMSLCCISKCAIIFVLIVFPASGEINTHAALLCSALLCFAVLMPGLFFSESFEVLSAFMEIKPLLNKLFHRL